MSQQELGAVDEKIRVFRLHVQPVQNAEGNTRKIVVVELVTEKSHGDRVVVVLEGQRRGGQSQNEMTQTVLAVAKQFSVL
jgi:hypothetical protein